MHLAVYLTKQAGNGYDMMTYMKSAYILIALLPTVSILLASCSSGPTRSDWETCSTDADCILVEGPCDVPKAIHKEAQPTFEAFVAQIEERNSCAIDGRAQWSEEIKPGCTSGKCTPVYLHKLMKKRR